MRFIIVFLTAVAYSLFFLSCTDNKNQQKPAETVKEKTTTSDSCDIYFYYDADTITWEDDDHALFSPIIEMPKDGKWSNYQLKQLDSMLQFASKHDVPTLSIDVMNFNSYEWGTEKDVVGFIQKKIKERSLKNTHSSVDMHNPYPFWACSIYDSMRIKQNRDSIYYIVLFKITPSY